MNLIRITITLACLCALLALSAPALALDPAILDTARAAANEALKTDPAYRQAVAKGDREAQEKIAEATTRAMIIRHVQATFTPLQMKVDRKIDEVLEIVWDKIGTKMMTPAQKSRLQELFKEEFYKYMANNEATQVEAPYDSAIGSKLRAENLLINSYKLSIGFRNEVRKILQNINVRMGSGFDTLILGLLVNITCDEFDVLRSY